MASIGHVAVGMAAARIYRARGERPPLREMVLWSALSLAPDADVIGFPLGVEYGDPWGHRGATHSFVFSIGVGIVVAALVRWRSGRASFLRTAVMASLVLASHAVLDTMTNGGLGCALWWPFDLTRYFAPWNPIPVAPIGLAFLSLFGLFVSAIELILFAPLFVYGWRAGRTVARTRTWMLAPWVVAVWLIASQDPVREAVLSFMFRDDTQFAAGFSTDLFEEIKVGDPPAAVRAQLGQPFREAWFYPVDSAHGCEFVLFEGPAVTRAQPEDMCEQGGIAPGAERSEVEQRLGPPDEACLQYTRSPSGNVYQLRGVCFADDKVRDKLKMWVRD
jgi:inner membrane protein